MKKTIFILGCGTMQIPALQIASEMGWRVVGADRNPDAPGCEICDKFFPVDLRDTESLIQAAREVNIKDRLDGVFTTGTDFSVAVATIAREFNLPGHSVEAARNATNKQLMRQRFAECKVPVPGFSAVRTGDNLALCVKSVLPPWVVKPVDSMAARGVSKVRDFANLEQAVAKAISISWSSTAIVESCIEGPEFSLDALIDNGKIIRCGLADRHICFPPYFVEIGHTIPSEISSDIAEEIWQVFEQGIKALGLEHGAAKGDIKFGLDGAVVVEIAGRLSGGYMSGWTWPIASGMQTNMGGLRLAVGLAPDLPLPPHKLKVSAERALIGINGRVKQIRGREAALAIPGVKEVFIRFQRNARTTFPTNNMEKLANVITVAATHQEAEEIAMAALRELRFILDENCEETGFYLESEAPFPPDNFNLYENSPPSLFRSIKTLWEKFPPRPFRRHQNGSILFLPGEVFQYDNFCDFLGRSMHQIIQILEKENLCRATGQITLQGDNSLPTTVPGRKESDFLKAMVKGGLPGARWFLERQPCCNINQL